ncbi:MAG: sigma 54-interacting transcriptional regulator, partial [Myxococcales bacterium]|nr:sigma 54-interacting transcriptional regulator [Myxococcales bacterium]
MSFDGNETISAPVPVPHVVVALRDQGRGKEHALALDGRRFVIGKSPGCDVVVDDPYVSGVHCLVERRGDGGLLVRDSGSKNGTQVNGIPIEIADVGPGSVITIGQTRLVALSQRGRAPLTAVEQLRGRDPRFRAAVDLALRAAHAECSVLVVGETGTGKELVARAIHEASPRGRGRFVALNCGAIPRELIGAELFGHVRGAYTGATDDRDGVFVTADGGTLFLDELGELPLDLQPNLLRVLETRRVRRVGGSDERDVDVRIVAATNRLEGLGTEASPLRLDLYHRVAAVVVTLPPLRVRRDDILELAEAFLDEVADRFGRRKLTADARDAMWRYDWPGNVRELRLAISRGCALRDGDVDAAALGLAPLDNWRDPAAGSRPGARDHRAVMRPLRSDGLPRHERLVRDDMA